MINWIDSPLTSAICTAIIHSLWQGLVIISVNYLVIKAGLLHDTNKRYWLHTSSLGILFVLFVYGIFDAIQIETVGAPVFESISEVAVAGFTENAVEASQTFELKVLVGQIWIVGMILFLMRFLVGSYTLYKVSREAIEPSEFWKDKWENVCSRMGVTRKVRLKASMSISVPMVIGVIKPVIAIPVIYFNQMTVDEMESIMIHELTHVRRHDFLVNVIQYVIESCLYFNPATWWLSGQIRRTREYSCDDQVNRAISSKTAYLKALYKVAEHSHFSDKKSIALINDKSELVMRVQRMLHKSKEELSLHPSVSLFSIGMMVSLFLSFQYLDTGRLIEGQAPENQDDITVKYQSPILNDWSEKVIQVEETMDLNIPVREEFKEVPLAENGKTIVDKRESSSTALIGRILPVEDKLASLSPVIHQTPKIASSDRQGTSVLVMDTVPSDARIMELERLLEMKTEELEELSEQLSEEMEEAVEIEVERMEELAEQLEEMIEPKIEALENDINEEEIERLEDLAEELEEIMEDRMEEWEEMMEEEVIEEYEEALEELGEQLEELAEEGDSEANKAEMERTQREMESIQQKLEKEMHAFHKAHEEMNKDPKVKRIHEEMAALSQKISQKHHSHAQIWTDEAKALQQEIEMIQREVEQKVSGMANGLHAQINEKAIEVEKIARELHELRRQRGDE